MALQISFTDKRGVANTEAYVIINEINLLPLQKICYFQAQMWHNSTARSKADATQRKAPVFHIDYRVTESDFDTYVTDSVIKQNDKSLMSQLYTWLKQHEDLAIPPTAKRENHGRNINWTTATDV
tara:strand:+ start:1094 stop:1468 length:375 start_codon:yes stop_codon:yes gene_type:complete